MTETREAYITATPTRAPGIILLAGVEPYEETSPQTDHRREYDCVFIQAGPVMRADNQPSRWSIPPQVLEAATPLFESIACYLDHPDEFGLFGERQSPKVRNLVGVTHSVYYDPVLQAICGTIRLYDTEPGSPAVFVRTVIDQVLADKAAGRETPPIGLSAVFYHTLSEEEEGGTISTQAIHHVESVDFVYSPGARGYVRAALTPQPATPAERTPMDENGTLQPPQVPENVPTLDLSSLQQEMATMRTQIATATSTVAALSAQMAEREQAQTIQGMGTPPRAALHLGRTGIEQVQTAVEAMLAGVRPADGIQPLTGLRELYHILSGDYEMSGVFQRDRVYLANVTASTMAQMVANVLNKRVMIEFAQYPQWWTPIVTMEDFNSLQQIRWITLGGVGELPTVAEGAAYTELTWNDIAQRDTFVKKGGYLGLTIEAIDKDDTRRLAAAPRALAQAAWLTLSKAISNIFTQSSGVGPDIYYNDSSTRALFHSSNSNLGTTALSWTTWQAVRIAMRSQAETNSSEPLGALTAPRYLLVPNELEMTALQILGTEGIPGSADYGDNPEAAGDAHDARMRAARERVIVIDMWTNANNWAAVADPRLWPSIGLGFRYGRQPEVFSVADPTAGLMFSNDTMPVKVRFFYATGPVDWRGLYKSNI